MNRDCCTDIIHWKIELGLRYDRSRKSKTPKPKKQTKKNKKNNTKKKQKNNTQKNKKQNQKKTQYFNTLPSVDMSKAILEEL